jgi:predicted acyltransferase
MSSEIQSAATELPATGAASIAKSERLVSLDAFRGLTMMLMVLVNNAGSDAIYHQLSHSPWDGWTIADTIFPSFLWIMGVAITLSFGKRLHSGATPSSLFGPVARRAALLYVFGLIGYAAPAFDLSTQRLLGVLQRIAICYLIASFIYLITGIRGQLLWIAGLLASYWLLMTLVPVPGFGPGHLSKEGNLAHYVDRLVLGRHNYASTKTWDPEGIVSTLPSIATVLFGIMAGHVLRMKRVLAERIVWLYLAGTCLLAAGLICDIWLPINKKLWSDSFALFMAGLDFVVFAGFLWLVDGCGWKRVVRPFVIMGMNAIAVYMLSELFDQLISGIHFRDATGSVSVREWVFHTIFAPLASPSLAALAYAVAYTALMYAFAFFLYKRQWFLRV